jgi:3-keto-5-aminohexanoate cleavage enzyme
MGPVATHRPMIISVALTGAIPSKTKYPTLPVEPLEIAEHALLCAELGASIVHLHTRDEHGNQTQDLERLQTAVETIRAENADLVICATTTSRGAGSLGERTTALRLPQDLLPDMASLTLGSYNTPFGVNVNPADDIELLLSEMAAVGVKPELEIFEPGMVHYWNHLVAERKAPDAAIANVLLGVLGASPASAKSLVDIVGALPSDLEWAVAGIGRYQKSMVALGAAMGGHVRVGMEDDPRGEREGWTNMDSVRRAVFIADAVGRPVASPNQARELLGLRENLQS